jgi:TRAP-type C4-dicarboxylate transport system permease small subunit
MTMLLIPCSVFVLIILGVMLGTAAIFWGRGRHPMLTLLRHLTYAALAVGYVALCLCNVRR